MDFEVFKDELIIQAKKIDVILDEEQIQKFYKYMELLLEWNEKINLTAIVEPRDVILKHFVDSLTICKELQKNKTLADIGTGAGFPGIPVKILRPDLDITLIDSLNKRVNFLTMVIEALKLEKIIARHGRIEDFGKNKKYREKFDYVTSRAVANLSTLSEYMIPLVKIDGKCICMKGSKIDEELKNAEKAIKTLGGKIEKVDTFLLPDTDMGRNIILIKKEKATPNKYPRKAGTPAKEPI